MKKIFQYLIPGCVFLILLGCEFEDPTVEGPSPLSATAANTEMALQILKFRNADTNKQIGFSYSNFAIGPEYGLEGTPQLRLEGFNNSSDCRGELLFGQQRVNCDVESARAGMGIYPEVFDEALFQYLGQEVEISFSNPAYRLSDSGKPTLYIPDAIVMTSPVRNRENGHTPALRQGLPLQWRASPRGGDFIIVACDIHSLTRPIVHGQPTTFTVNYEVVPDNGRHVLGANLLKGFPKGERVTLFFMRVSFAVEDISSNRGTEKVKLYAYTLSSYMAILQ